MIELGPRLEWILIAAFSDLPGLVCAHTGTRVDSAGSLSYRVLGG